MEIENFHEIDIDKENTFSPSIKDSLQNIISKEGYVTHKVFKRQISTGGGNYLGDLFEVDVKGRTPVEEKELNLFVKRSVSQTTNESEAFLSVSGVYAKEQFFYDELARVFSELEKGANVPKEHRLRTIKSYTVSSLDAIIMENLRKRGYDTLHRMEVFPLEFAELAVKQLATLHGLSLVLREKKPEYFNSKLRTLSKPMIYNDKFKQLMNESLNISKSHLDEEWQRKVENSFSKFVDKYIENFELERSSVNCLCHGDYRQNNILIKTTNGKIDDVIPIDYQLIHVGNPLNDFFYLIYLGSDRKFRKQHLMDLKNFYYDSLKNLMQYFDINVEDVFPRETFENDFKERREMGLITGSFFGPYMFVIEEDVPTLEDFERGKERNFRLAPEFRGRIQEWMEEFEELGYF